MRNVERTKPERRLERVHWNRSEAARLRALRSRYEVMNPYFWLGVLLAELK